MTTKGRRGRSPGVNGADAIPAATPSEYGVEMATRRTVKRTAAKTGKTAKKKVAARKTAVKKAAVKRSEEHTSELQSLMRISYAVFCLKKKKHTNKNNT